MTLDDCLRLDVRRLMGAPGGSVVSWVGCEASIGFSFEPPVDPATLILDYAADGVPVREAFPLDTTAPHYGGRRWWARCLGCSRRVAVLYLARSRFRCGRCVGLPYGSTRERPDTRAIRRSRRIRARLNRAAGVAERFPDKPPRMRWETYAALRARDEQAQWTMLSIVARSVDRLTASVARLAARRSRSV